MLLCYHNLSTNAKHNLIFMTKLALGVCLAAPHFWVVESSTVSQGCWRQLLNPHANHAHVAIISKAVWDHVTVTMIGDTGINEWMNLPTLRHAAHHVASWCSYAVVVIWAVSIHEIARQTDTAILTKFEQHTFEPLTMTPVLLMCHSMKWASLLDWSKIKWCTSSFVKRIVQF